MMTPCDTTSWDLTSGSDAVGGGALSSTDRAPQCAGLIETTGPRYASAMRTPAIADLRETRESAGATSLPVTQ